MDGGPAAIRGYLVQTLVALLEALDEPEWISVTLEPDHASAKTDIFWEYKERTKAVQVKSSVNPFKKADVQRWAGELAASRSADEYELILVGEAGSAVRKLGRVGKVQVPPPKTLDLDASIERAAHRLDRFLESQKLPRGSADYREMVAGAMVEKLERFSAGSHPFQRAELIEQLKRWITQETPVFPIFDCPARNPWFTGRDKEITDLRGRLSQTGKAAIGQAISGLGGIGKTQTAVEYAHRHREQYDAVFWINAATDLDLQTGYGGIAKLLRLPHDAKDPDSIVAAVKRWLEGVDGHRWLLILDNADEPPLVEPYLPSKAPNGHIVVTSRMRLDVLGIPSALRVEELHVNYSTQFLLNRAGRLPDDESEREAARELAIELDGLPLALEQAAAYVTAMHVSYRQFLDNYRTRKLGLLERRGPVTGAYPATVAKTWLINFEQVEAMSRAASDLLRLSAMLDPNAIPFELLTEGAKELGPPLRDGIDPSNPLSVNEALEPLARFSLVSIDLENQTYSIHRLVQEVVKDAMGDDGQRLWAERVTRALDAAFPYIEFDNWSICDRLIAQAMHASKLIGEFAFRSGEAGRLLNQTAFYLHCRGQYAAAEPLYQQSLEIRRQVFGEYHPHVATSLNNLAALYRWTGRLQEAALSYRESLDVYRHLSPVPIDDFIATINNLALVYQLMGQYDDAEPLFAQARELCRRTLGENSRGFASIISNQAMLYEAAGRYDEARPLLQQALQIRRAVLGERHPEYSLNLNNLAMLSATMGRYEEAETLLQEALVLCRTALGEDHPQFATSLNNLAELYCTTGRYEEAEPLHRRVLEIRRRVLGERHPEFADSLNNLAELYRATGRDAEAEPLYQQALDVYRRALGQQHPRFARTLNNLAGLYLEAERYADAEPLHRRAMEIRRQVLGEQHPDYAQSLNNLAWLFYTTSRFAEADPLYRQAIEILQKRLGPKHPMTEAAQANYDALRQKLGSTSDGD